MSKVAQVIRATQPLDVAGHVPCFCVIPLERHLYFTLRTTSFIQLPAPSEVDPAFSSLYSLFCLFGGGGWWGLFFFSK